MLGDWIVYVYGVDCMLDVGDFKTTLHIFGSLSVLEDNDSGRVLAFNILHLAVFLSPCHDLPYCDVPKRSYRTLKCNTFLLKESSDVF